MEGAVFQTRISAEDPVSLSSTGCDQLEFFLASNRESPPTAQQIASGGEISRIMLSIKSALAQSDPPPAGL